MFTRFVPPPQINSVSSPKIHSPNGSGNVMITSEQRFSLAHLKEIHLKLVENKIVTAENEDLVVEVLYTIAEMVVYGDNKSELLFDFFCEKNMLSLFLEIMWANVPDGVQRVCPNKVHIQILQTLSILINSVKNDTSLYYLLSNNYINEIIVFPHIFEDDESLRDQFVSFIKSLSLRLNTQTVQFFFVEETGAFPLLSRAIDIIRFTEPMVRIACQTTILNILQVSDSRARSYALQNELILKFLAEVVRIMNLYYFEIVRINIEYLNIISNAGITTTSITTEYSKSTLQSLERLENSLDDITAALEDWMYFMQDVLGLRIMKLRHAFVSYILSQFIYPTLLSSSYSRVRKETLNQDIFSIRKFDLLLSTGSEATSPTLSHSTTILPISNLNETIETVKMDRYSSLSGNPFTLSSSQLQQLDRNSIKEMHGITRSSVHDSDTNIPTSRPSYINIPIRSSHLDESDEESKNHSLTQSEILIRSAVSTYFLSQMLLILIDPLLNRAILISLLHPLNCKGRDQILQNSSTNISTSHVNRNRCTFQYILSAGDRLSLLGGLLWVSMSSSKYKLAFHDISEDSTNEYNTKYVDEYPLKQSQSQSTESTSLSIPTSLQPSPNNKIISTPLNSSYSDIFLIQSKSLYEWDYEENKKYSHVQLLEQEESEVSYSMKSRTTTLASSLGSNSLSGSFSPQRRLYQVSPNPKPVSIRSKSSYPASSYVIPSDQIKEEDKNESETFTNLDTDFAIETVPIQPKSNHISALSAELAIDTNCNLDSRNGMVQHFSESILMETLDRRDMELMHMDYTHLPYNKDKNISKNIFSNSDTIDGLEDMSIHILSIKSLIKLEEHSESMKSYIPTLSQSVFEILSKALSDHPIATLQAMVHGIYYHCLLLHDAINSYINDTNNTNNTSNTCTSNQNIPNQTIPSQITTKENIITNESNISNVSNISTESSYKDQRLDELIGNNHYILSKVFTSIHPIAKALSDRLASPVSDAIIDMLIEELKRMQEASWTSYYTKISQLPLLILPTTSLSLEKLGSDHRYPSHQMDEIRREIQIFLLLRSLYIQTKRMILSPKDIYQIDDIGNRVLDDMLWASFLEKVIIPNELSIGRPFKMKGKRYLDVCIRTRQSSVDSNDSSNHPSTTTNTTDSSMLSVFTFGYFGGGSSSTSKRQSVSPSPSPSPSSSSLTTTDKSIQNNTTITAMGTSTSVGIITVASTDSSNPNLQTNTNNLSLGSNLSNVPGNVTTKVNVKGLFGEILFVQDRSFLIIVKPESVNPRPNSTSDKPKGNIFKVFIVAPLILTDATIDPQDKTTLRIVVKAWEGDIHPNMDKVGSDTENISSITSPRYGRGYNTGYIPSYLPPKRNTCLFQVNIGFEVDLTCALAAEHIETRKQILREDRIKLLQKSLEPWIIPPTSTTDSSDIPAN